ncbi:hypothetical protein [Flammeovirga kamogawensis]|uniref:DUF2807 domain-containing protein n=1 Tax=Flammeovirga kamogawensis TaxID=373891 RepID=A0ABX8GQY7_9BACT|nr:hypothetical protein [Flammeovirga kamogawensis]MBB6462100.1 hypothetical protein [Flammeovirga kamogawensis]QWG05834.1 hypothetical protein KM029_10630 [Flammeovirga kamogawensis]TRX67659.1 hypothetical protein EO216_05645 [Flammeovirga kamogawensis]
MNQKLNLLLCIISLLAFISCENTDISNTAAIVEGTYRINQISAKTSQGQTTISATQLGDEIIITEKDSRIVDVQVIVNDITVSFGSSSQNFLNTTYKEVLVEGNAENKMFNLSKTINSNSNANLSGSITESGRISLSYNISGTEIFYLEGSKL